MNGMDAMIIRSVLMFVLGFLTGLVVMAAILPSITPRPMAALLRQLFKIPAFKPPEDWATVKQDVDSMVDVDYGDGGLTFDVHWPSSSMMEDNPVILWIHGGGFVGGSKTDTTGYCMTLASRGFTVVNIDYGLAPRYHHPRQVLDVDEVLCKISRMAEDGRSHPDPSRGLILAGDSAGAHIAAEYAALKTNPEYQAELKVSLHSPYDVDGVVLLCGLYSLSSFVEGSWWRRPIRFMSKQIGWAVTGHRGWYRSGQTERMDVIGHMTDDFPPALLSDGNWWTFDNQLSVVESALDGHGIRHGVVEFPRSKWRRLPHEFQFDLTRPESIVVFDKLVGFCRDVAQHGGSQPIDGFDGSRGDTMHREIDVYGRVPGTDSCVVSQDAGSDGDGARDGEIVNGDAQDGGVLANGSR